jgi:iron(III) transport system ATP-binding protein
MSAAVTDDLASFDRSAPVLELRDVRHAYGGRRVLESVSFALARGRIGCLLGPSGCGKTTVLRCIAGFEHLAGGSIAIGGLQVAGPRVHQPPERRRVGMVFQDYALFPHLRVRENVGFGLMHMPQPQRLTRVSELLRETHLGELAEAYPHELSGGQQQRVALARALAPKPEVLLLDEPLSNLDADLRERLGTEVRGVLQQEAMTAVLVTHDQHEAFAMADEIGILHQGVLQQWGSAYDLYHRPATRFVADFIGQGVFLPGRLVAPRRVELELGALPLNDAAADALEGVAVGAEIDVLLRPDDIEHDDTGACAAQIVSCAFRGARMLYRLRLDSGREVLSLGPGHPAHLVGVCVRIRLHCDHVIAFPRD